MGHVLLQNHVGKYEEENAFDIPLKNLL